MRLKILAALPPLLLSACAAAGPADNLSSISPLDPQSAIVPVRPSNYFDGFVDRRPVEPDQWRRRNENVAPGVER